MYATSDDIVSLHGADFLLVVAARGDDVSLADPLTSAAVTAALDQASSEIDGYLSTRYPTPVSPAPRIIQNHAINMAVYHLASTADRMTDIIRDRYKDALTWLKDISAGRANLPGGSDGAGSSVMTAAPEQAEFSGSEALFKRGPWG